MRVKSPTIEAPAASPSGASFVLFLYVQGVSSIAPRSQERSLKPRMLLSHEKRFYFIHVPKSAGTSVTQALMPWCVQRRIWWKLYGGALHRIGRTFVPDKRDFLPFSKHVTAGAQLEAHPYLKEYFGFSFVRNPWDREVSLYHYILRSNHHKRRIVLKMKDFDEYIRWRGERRNERDQVFWTHDKQGNQLVDFIGRYERLEEDFQTICKMIGITATLGKENASSHRDYRSYYSAETAVIVAELYKRDLKTFGYTFE
jgi:hypothetical protein